MSAENLSKLKTGDIPMIGIAAMRELFIGWTAPDPHNCTPDVVEGYNVSDYFDAIGCYKGPDQYGVEPVFRDFTPQESVEYLATDASPKADVVRVLEKAEAIIKGL